MWQPRGLPLSLCVPHCVCVSVLVCVCVKNKAPATGTRDD